MYMIVTNDEYEVPMGVFDTLKQTADALGISESTASRRMNEVTRKGNAERIVFVGKKRIKMTDEQKQSANKVYQARYRAKTDRSEYFRERYRRKKAGG